MKKLLSVLTALIVVSMLFSCGGGSGSESAAESAPVKVSFAVETGNDLAHVVSVNNPGATYTYWYAAVPQWQGVDHTSPKGATTAYGQVPSDNEYVQITDYAAGKDIGLFAQGSWKFYARVKNGNDIVYEGNTTDYISVSHNEIAVDVDLVAANGNATVSIDIETPNTGASSTITVAYSGQASGTFTPIAKNDPNPATNGAGWSRFTASKELAAGSYQFVITSSDGTAQVGKTTLAFDIIPGVDRTISGTMENGVYQTTMFTINIPSIKMTLTSAGSATSVAKNSSLLYTCAAEKVNTTGTILYQWYVDGEAINGATNSTFNFTPAQHYYNAEGTAVVTCKAYIVDKFSISDTMPVEVTPAL